MRTDNPPSPWAELIRAVPSTVLFGVVAGVFGWGVAYKGFTSSVDAQGERIGRLEAKQAADIAGLKTDFATALARLETATVERVTRLETATSSRFDALDRRGDGRMAAIQGRADKADLRDEQITEALNALSLRLTRLEAAREFVNANGTGESGRGGKR